MSIITSELKTAHDIIATTASKEMWFCPRPFDHLYSDTDGSWKVCCIGNDNGEDLNVRNTTPAEWLNSSVLNNLRDEMLRGEIGEHTSHHCGRCLTQEKTYGVSLRTHHIHWVKDPSELVYNQMLDYIKTGEYHLKERMIMLQTRVFGNQCNLDCYMCQPQNSTTRQASNNKINFNQYIRFDPQNKDLTKLSSIDTVEEIKKLAPYIKTFIIQGGEPLVMKKQFEFLDYLIEHGHAKHILLDMNSNMTVLGTTKYNILDYADKFAGLNVQVSLEGVGKYNDYIRRRSDWGTIVTNVKALRKVTPNVLVFSTVSLLSVLRFDQLIDWCKAEGMRQELCVLDDPDELHPKHLPQKIKDILIKKYEKYDVITSALKMEGDPEKFQAALRYIKATDKLYQTDIYDLYIELEEYDDDAATTE